MNAIPEVHDPLCEGHVDCPQCGVDQCAKVVVARSDGTADTVMCLTCFRVIGVKDVRDERKGQ